MRINWTVMIKMIMSLILAEKKMDQKNVNEWNITWPVNSHDLRGNGFVMDTSAACSM